MFKNRKRMVRVILTMLIVIVMYMVKKNRENHTSKGFDISVTEMDEKVLEHRRGIYEKYVKRIFDRVCAMGVIIIFSPLYIFIAIMVRIKLGSPIVFTQERPGIIGADGKETIFKMYKFRTMTNARDENGELLPDDMRMTSFGAWLRQTSCDELLEIFNILKGDMSLIGPRPQLVRDMVFMTDEQRKRHTVLPGLSGLAQVNGRNEIDWEERLNWDLKYIKEITFFGDMKIILKTIEKAFVKQEGITTSGMSTSEDFGDYLLRIGTISRDEYDEKQMLAKKILKENL